MDTGTIVAAVASGLLSGGGAGYLVSIYQIRQDTRNKDKALQLERDKFEHGVALATREREDKERAERLDFSLRRQAILTKASSQLNDMYQVVQDAARLREAIKNEKRDSIGGLVSTLLEKIFVKGTLPTILELNATGYHETAQMFADAGVAYADYVLIFDDTTEVEDYNEEFVRVRFKKDFMDMDSSVFYGIFFELSKRFADHLYDLQERRRSPEKAIEPI